MVKNFTFFILYDFKASLLHMQVSFIISSPSYIINFYCFDDIYRHHHGFFPYVYLIVVCICMDSVVGH
jgi:hypothetical protein